MKKLFLVSLVIMLVSGLLLISCAAPTPTTTPTLTPKPTTTPTSTTTSTPYSTPKPTVTPSTTETATKPIELRLTYHASAESDMAVLGLEPWARQIEKATGNKVKITSYPSGTLAKPQDAYDAAANGVADIAWHFTGMTPGRFALSEIIGLPYLGFKDALMASLTFQHVYDTLPEFKAEFPGVKLLIAECDYPTPIGVKKKSVQKLEDLAGLKLRIPGGPPTTFFKAAGAIPLNVPPGDIYSSLEKGVIDGYNMPYQGAVDNMLHDLCKYVTDIKFNSSPMLIVMNLAKWNSLPPDVQKGIDSLSGVAGSRFIGEAVNKATDNGRKMMLDKGNQIVSLTDEEQARWAKLATPIVSQFAKDLDAKGLAGTKTLNEISKFVQEYR